MSRWVPFIISLVAVAAMCAFIFWMSAKPADESGALSMGVVWHVIGFIVPGYDQMSPVEQLSWQRALDYPVRKAAHFTEYAVLGALALNALWQGARALRFGMRWDASRERRHPAAAPGTGDAAAASRCAGAPRIARGGGRPRPDGPSLARLGLAAWALSTAYAATDEFHQLFVPGRSGMLSDVVLDSCGVLVGVLVCALVLRRQGGRRGGA